MAEANSLAADAGSNAALTDSDPMARYQARNQQPLDVQRIFTALKGLRRQPRSARVSVSEGQIVSLCSKVKSILSCEQTVVNLDGPVIICGDIHGQFHDLCRLFDAGGWPPEKKYLFMGDYVDRGTHSLETIILLFSLKVMYPDKVILLRGNHECSSINRVYGFYDDCKRRYSIKIWKVFGAAFDYLPLAAVVSKRIFCVHGGLSPDVHDLPAIRSIERPLSDNGGSGPASDLLWSDPDHDITGWGENDRGVGFCFGSDVVRGFLQRNNLDLVCRAHQVVQDGYEFFAERKLVTVFSAPNYCNEFDNAAAMLAVSESLICSFIIVKPEVVKEEDAGGNGKKSAKSAKGKKGKGGTGRRQTQFIGKKNEAGKKRT